MKQEKSKNLCIAFTVVLAAFTIRGNAQEFKGFYGNNHDAGNYAPASRYYKSGHSSNKHSDYISVNSDAYYASESNPYYPNGYSYQSFEENRSHYLPASLTINIFSPDYTRAASNPEYYNRSSGYNYYNRDYYSNYNDYNRGYYPNYNDNNRGYYSNYNDYNRGYYPNYDKNRLPDGIKTTKINGNRYYEMNGNYYRADRLENAGYPSYRTDQLPGDQYYVAKGLATRDGVYLPAGNDIGNPNYVVDGYNNQDNTYTTKGRVDNRVSVLQKQQEVLQKENNELKQRLNQQQAMDAEQDIRLQKIRKDNEAQERQEAQKDDMTWREANRNNETEANAFYNNVNVGDTVDQVPKNSKSITIDGKKTYISPRNAYYQKQKNGKFMVVGMEGK